MTCNFGRIECAETGQTDKRFSTEMSVMKLGRLLEISSRVECAEISQADRGHLRQKLARIIHNFDRTEFAEASQTERLIFDRNDYIKIS